MKGKGGATTMAAEMAALCVQGTLKRVGLSSQAGNGWNCVCCTAYKSRCWQYLSMSQTILPGDGNGEMRINSLPLLPSAPVRSFHPHRNPPLQGNMWGETDKYKASREPPASAPRLFRHNSWGHFNVFCPETRLSRLSFAEIPCKRWSVYSSFKALPVHHHYIKGHQL